MDRLSQPSEAAERIPPRAPARDPTTVHGDREDFQRVLAEYGPIRLAPIDVCDLATLPADAGGLMVGMSEIHGHGMFASESIHVGQRLTHSLLDLFINHSATPNVMFAMQGPHLGLVAMQGIVPGAEVVGDYRQLCTVIGVVPHISEIAVTLGIRLRRLWDLGVSPIDVAEPPVDGLVRMVRAILGRFGYLPPMAHVLDWAYCVTADC